MCRHNARVSALDQSLRRRVPSVCDREEVEVKSSKIENQTNIQNKSFGSGNARVVIDPWLMDMGEGEDSASSNGPIGRRRLRESCGNQDFSKGEVELDWCSCVCIYIYIYI